MADVLAGKVVVSSWVRKAVERQQRDLKDGHKRGLVFDRDRAARAVRFFRALTHVEDTFTVSSGSPFVLEPHQQAFLTILFGWRRTDGHRRWSIVYKEVARGNGKSKEASGISLYVLAGEGTKGSTVYSVATKKDQAKIIFDDAVLMAQASPALSILVPFRNNLHIPGTASKFEPLSSDEKSLDGLKPNMFAADELHMMLRGTWNKCKTALGKKPGSFILATTTAGTDRHSVCYEQRSYAEKVLDGYEDDSFFPWICALDKDDDPFDEANWPKANPNLGISVSLETIRDAAKQAQMIPSEYNEFLRMRCNIWTDSDVAWMPHHLWEACKGEQTVEQLRASLKGRQCFGGLDLSSSEDLTCFSLVFPPKAGDEPWKIVPFFWLPTESVQKRVKKDRVPYDVWIRDGLIEKTEGNVIDETRIIAKILELAKTYDIREIGYDPHLALPYAIKLEGHGLKVKPVRQGNITLTAPTKRLMELTLKHDIAHAGHKVLAWNASNAMAVVQNGLIRLDKERSTERIDGMAATITALEPAILATDNVSVYESRGVRYL
jgi:phage terminase large subunit-like protein